MGGVAGPELAAAVAEAGGGGVIGLYSADGDTLRHLIEQARRLTRRPYGVNLIPEVSGPELLASQIDQVLRCSSPDVFVTFFGLPPAVVSESLKRARRCVLIQVGDVAQARAAAEFGADAVILQGIEAGGRHLGDWPTGKLVAAVLDARVTVPVLASGGAGSPEEVAALLDTGAAGVSCGTAFVATIESRAHPVYKARVLRACGQDTMITDVFNVGWPGRRHRVIRTPRAAAARGPDEPAFVGRTWNGGRPYLIANGSATVPTTDTSGRIEEMALYCGTSCSGVRISTTAAAVVQRLARPIVEH
jgi:nitronate monooxygenase